MSRAFPRKITREGWLVPFSRGNRNFILARQFHMVKMKPSVEQKNKKSELEAPARAVRAGQEGEAAPASVG